MDAKRKLKKSIVQWTLLESVFIALFIVNTFLTAENDDREYEFTQSQYIYLIVNIPLMLAFVSVKSLIAVKVRLSPILQTRARLKVTECAQAYVFTASIVTGYFVAEGIFSKDQWTDTSPINILNSVVMACFCIYVAWWSLLAIIYTCVLLYSLLTCELTKVKQIMRELSYRRDPRENDA